MIEILKKQEMILVNIKSLYFSSFYLFVYIITGTRLKRKSPGMS